MRFQFLLALLLLSSAYSAQNVHGHEDPFEVRFIRAQDMVLESSAQLVHLQSPSWTTYTAAHPKWRALFDERSGMPQRAFGPGIPTIGNSPEARAAQFISSALSPFSLPIEDLELQSAKTNAKHHILFYAQMHEGKQVLNSTFMIKMTLDGRVISWKADIHPNMDLGDEAFISSSSALNIASQGLPAVSTSEMEEELAILPIPASEGYQFRTVYEGRVSGMSESGVPYRYYTLVDAVSGLLHYRSNEIHSYSDCGHAHVSDNCPNEPPPVTINLQLSADTWVSTPDEPMENRPLRLMRVDIDGQQYQTDNEGMLSAPVDGPASSFVRFVGDYARVALNGVTPAYQTELQEGDNDLSANGEIDQEVISGYMNTNVIHDYMKTVIPAHLGMDFPLPVNVGITPHDCNAYYDGESINFFIASGTCRSLVNVADVVYHEYGHGINNTYYQSFNANYSNGAMNEGYADVWAFAVHEDPLLGNGLNPNNPNDLVRRYDINPKVYPQDLVGQVHNDGEIIAGAWWDTYLELGSDMEMTMQIFALAYDGLQATAMNGDEGAAYSDVLIDALEADDDDGDLSNGSPNGDAIIEGFDIHGISLVASVDLQHDVEPYLNADETLSFIVDADVSGLYNTSIDNITMHYRTSANDPYQEVVLSPLNDDEYEAVLPAQADGTLIEYYISASATGGESAGTLPARVLDELAVLPYYSLVGYMVILEDDQDGTETLTNWQVGLPSDGADTGQWESADPVSTFIGPTIVAPGSQTTPGGTDCFVTANAGFQEAAGVNDIDAGTVTLRSGVINLNGYDDPVMEYHRWYTNNTGANPNADWWQVQVSDDGGDSWVYVENTMTSETEWRQKMFRITDYVDLTNEFMVQFNASDSLRPGIPQNGGSLVEAALDDFKIHDSSEPNALDEVDFSRPLLVYPNPTSDRIILSADEQNPLEGVVQIFDTRGRIVYSAAIANRQRIEIDVTSFANGRYTVKMIADGKSAAAGSFVKE